MNGKELQLTIPLRPLGVGHPNRSPRKLDHTHAKRPSPCYPSRYSRTAQKLDLNPIGSTLRGRREKSHHTKTSALRPFANCRNSSSRGSGGKGWITTVFETRRDFISGGRTVGVGGARGRIL